MNEYFCKDCFQLRLNATGKEAVICGNCRSKNIVVGQLGELDKQELIKQTKIKRAYE